MASPRQGAVGEAGGRLNGPLRKAIAMFKHILLPVDLNHDSSWNKALPVAASLAEANGAQLSIITVVPDFGMAVVGTFFPGDYAETVVRETEGKLDAFIKEHVPASLDPSGYVRHGAIYSEIMTVADAIKADLIVLASHRPEMKDYLLGPNAARVVRHARQSVFVVRP